MLKCNECGHVFDEDDAVKKAELVDSGPGYKYYEHYYACPECDSDEVYDFDYPYEECSDYNERHGCFVDCNDCKLYQRKEEEENGNNEDD